MELNIGHETLYLTLIGIVISAIIFFKRRGKSNLPPGPYNLPLVGYLPFLRQSTLHSQLFEIGQKLGPIFSIKLGSQPYVILSNTKVIKEVYSKTELNGRPDVPLHNFTAVPSPFFDSGEEWIQHKKFLTHCFRELGVGRETVQEYILDQMEDLISKLNGLNGEPIYILPEMDICLNNVISMISSGRKNDLEIYKLMKKNYENGLSIFRKISIFLFFPWLLHLPMIKKITSKQLEPIRGVSGNIASVIRTQIKEQEKVTNNIGPNSLINMYISEVKNKEGSSKYTFDEDSFIGVIVDLYGAGIPTTVPSLEWCFYNMAARPDIQLKVLKEIDEVIGNDRLPTLSDQKDLHYTHAVLLEVQRLYSTVWITFPRLVSKDITVAGYEIPKNTSVMTNVYAAHYDPNSWENPESFCPERFLDPNNPETVVKYENLITFSYGKRMCPGEALAQMEIFLCFVRIMQKFEVQPANGKSIDLKGVVTIVNNPRQQEICFFPRKRKFSVN